MVIIPNPRLWDLVQEDVPYMDLTTDVLGIGDAPGVIEYYTREDCLLACMEEVVKMMRLLGAEVVEWKRSGTHVAAGETFLKARGTASSLHAAWRVCLNIVAHCSAIATKTEGVVAAMHAENPRCELLTTRKSMPGAKDLMVKAVMVGGAFPHRLGLSESILVFDHHLEFMGGIDGFIDALPDLRARCIEKKIFVEANAEDSLRLAREGIDGLQFDKVPVADLAALVAQIRAIDQRIVLIAAGGINAGNAADYAATGVDGLATSAMFSAKPLDMSVRMRAL